MKTLSDIHRKIIPLILAALAFLILTTCSDDSVDSTLGDQYIDSKSSLNIIDTFSVKLSTVMIDSIITSGSGSMLVGNYIHGMLGKISCSSYFKIGNPADDYLDLPEDDDTYDSLSLVLQYNKYYFGDTAKVQKLTVYQLTENIDYNASSYITSHQTFSHESKPLGSLDYYPRPNNPVDTISIKLSDELGRDLLTKLKDHSETISDDEIFQNYFHGILLTDEATESPIIGFHSGATKLILYTSRQEETKETISYDFVIDDTTKQFNNIAADFAATGLNNLKKTSDRISSDLTGGLAFIQGGIGLGVRVDFPTLPSLLLQERGTIMKAELSVYPQQGSYNDVSLPSDLIAYEVDKNNVESSSGFQASSTLTEDPLYLENTNYVFDITQFLTSQLADQYIDPNKGLLILLPDIKLQASFSRLFLNAKSRDMKLKFYYLSY